MIFIDFHWVWWHLGSGCYWTKPKHTRKSLKTQSDYLKRFQNVRFRGKKVAAPVWHDLPACSALWILANHQKSLIFIDFHWFSLIFIEFHWFSLIFTYIWCIYGIYIVYIWSSENIFFGHHFNMSVKSVSDVYSGGMVGIPGGWVEPKPWKIEKSIYPGYHRHRCLILVTCNKTTPIYVGGAPTSPHILHVAYPGCLPPLYRGGGEMKKSPPYLPH